MQKKTGIKMLRARGRGERDKSGRRETGGTENHEKNIIYVICITKHSHSTFPSHYWNLKSASRKFLK